ncbi:hypothetical protein PGT21_050119 [Puccinia graminis f. sp. tritici]|uniref:Uncharacterized protein n=1 Tax=Puccinia graminis f. sp. tritici TaxID=56615 RepID=A0A5B0NFY5_PUCGR|nr:hypothetical protein PGT21_050119 [Puccinia graminis f. sp. tritici]
MNLKPLVLLFYSIIHMAMGDLLSEYMRITPGKNYIIIDYSAKTPKENMFKTKIITSDEAKSVLKLFTEGERAIEFLKGVYENELSIQYSISIDRNTNENPWFQSKHNPYNRDYYYHSVPDDLALFLNEVFTSILWHSFKIDTSEHWKKVSSCHSSPFSL